MCSDFWLLLDVDDTLYAKGTGPFREVNERIEIFVMRRLALTRPQTKALRNDYIKQYGSTLSGLMQEHGVDPDEFLREVHDVPVETILAKDLRLREMLASLPFSRIAFSNGSRDYIQRVLTTLDVLALFTGIFAIEDMDYIPKPRPHGYAKLIEFYKRPADSFIMIDDRRENVMTALSLGMHGIVIDQDNTSDDIPAISDIYALPQALARYAPNCGHAVRG